MVIPIYKPQQAVKCYTKIRPEFGPDNEGRIAYIVQTAYRLKETGSDFCNHLRDCMCHLGYAPTNADNNVWNHVATNGQANKYYEVVLLYVDDCLVISFEANKALGEIEKFFQLKPNSIGPPKIYLGGKVSKVTLPNGIQAWLFSATQYVRTSIKNVE